MKNSSDKRVRIFSAGTVFPVGTPPIRNASVAVVGDRILNVGERKAVLAEYPGSEELRWEGVLMPGLVNAHSHLQYTGFSELGVVTHSGFEEWSMAFDEMYTRKAPVEDWHAMAMAGAGQAIRSGTTTIADICTDLAALSVLEDAGLPGMIFLEVMGGSWSDWVAGGRKDFLDQLDKVTKVKSDRISVGVSPHAPYSLDTRVLADLADIGITMGMKLHTHLAESNWEDDYYRDGKGPLADFVVSIWPEFQILKESGSGLKALEYTAGTGLFAADTYIAHGIYIDGPGRAILRENDVPVALCPRSNIIIGLDPPPIAAYLEEGNRICVGTDSLSSSPSLDLLEDVKLLRELAIDQGYRNPDLSSRLLAAATIDGAKVIGRDTADAGIGVIEAGRRADFAVFAVDAAPENVEETIVTSGAGNCVATVIGGETVHGSPEA